MGRTEGEGSGPFSAMLTRQCTHMQFHLNTTEHNAFTVKVIKHRSKLSREAVESPSVEILKIQLCVVLGNLL